MRETLGMNSVCEAGTGEKGRNPVAVDPSVGSMLTHPDTVSKPISSHSSPAVASTKGLFQDKMGVEENDKTQASGAEVVLSQSLLSPRAVVAKRWPTDHRWSLRSERLVTADLGNSYTTQWPVNPRGMEPN